MIIFGTVIRQIGHMSDLRPPDSFFSALVLRKTNALKPNSISKLNEVVNKFTSEFSEDVLKGFALNVRKTFGFRA